MYFNLLPSIPLVPKGAPRYLLLEAVSNTAITLNWTVPIIDDLDGNLTRYEVVYHGFVIDTEERVETIVTSSLENQTLVLSGLEDFTLYFVSVKAATIGFGPAITGTVRTLEAGMFSVTMCVSVIEIYYS